MPSGVSPGLPYGNGLLDLPPAPFALDPVESIGPREPPTRLCAEGLEDGLQELVANLLAPPAAGRQTLLVVVSDGSRRTGAHRYLPRLVALLRQKDRFDIRFIVASGLHRRPVEDEVARILGGDLADKFPVFLHDPDDADRLAELGTTRRGTVVQVNRHLLEHHRILLTGSVGFHYHAGFSGGRKSLVPGLAGRKTITGNHLWTLQSDGARHPESRAGVLEGNPVHEDMLEGASMVRPVLMVNTVQDRDGSFEGIWTGDMESAHRKACSYLMRTRAIRLVPRELVVVSAGGHPSDINLIQAHKAFESIFPAVRPGGTVILTAACPEGLGDDEFREGILTGSDAELAASLLADYRVYGQTALAWRRKVAGCRLILVSRLPPSLVRETGGEPAGSLAEAMQLAAARLQGPVKGWLFRQGSRWLVEPVNHCALTV